MTNPPTPPEPQPSVIRFGDLKQLIADTVKGLTGGQQNPPPPQRTGTLRDQTRDARETQNRRSVDDEVRDAIAKLERDKERAARDSKIDESLAELQERTKEKPPVERKRRHRFMGWGD